jgi:hypothetical protein
MPKSREIAHSWPTAAWRNRAPSVIDITDDGKRPSDLPGVLVQAGRA